MYEDTKLDEFQNLLLLRLNMLENQQIINSDARKTVMLDQNSVGRLSRMDALQQQSMAFATERARKQEIAAIQAALARIAAKEFGYCDECGEQISEKRLVLSPTAIKCVGCIEA